MIVHVDSFRTLETLAHVSEKWLDAILNLKEPVTYILSKKETQIFSVGLNSIAIRIPLMPLAIEFLTDAGPVSAPSANLSGKPSITCSEDAYRIFNSKVDLILRGESSKIGLESTIINLTKEIPVFLRPGSVSFMKAREYFPELINFTDQKNQETTPGMKYRHYAPDGIVMIINSLEEISVITNAGYIGFNKIKYIEYSVVINNNIEYMHELYRFLNDCDRRRISLIYCQMPLEDEFKPALLNRLAKAVKK